MPSVACGSVGTGTDSGPAPRSPSTVTRTCQAPAVIIQSWPVNSRGSSADRAARSATGANCAPGPVSGSGTIRTSRTSSLVVEDFDVGDARIACGGRTVTNTRYGPACAVEEHVGAADVSASARGMQDDGNQRDREQTAEIAKTRRHVFTRALRARGFVSSPLTFCIARPA